MFCLFVFCVFFLVVGLCVYLLVSLFFCYGIGDNANLPLAFGGQGKCVKKSRAFLVNVWKVLISLIVETLKRNN